MKESAIQKKISDWLRKERGAIVVKVDPSRYSAYPDLLVFLPAGRVMAIEVKQPGKKPTQAQYLRLLEFANRGYEAYWADNLETVKEIVDAPEA